MSESRLTVPKSLIDILDRVDNEGQRYRDAHLRDGCYDELQKAVREKLQKEKLGDAFMDYVNDFASNYGVIRFVKGELDELDEEIKKGKEIKTYPILASGYASGVTKTIHRLQAEIGFFKQAAGVSEEEKKDCDQALEELEKLEKAAKGFMEAKS